MSWEPRPVPDVTPETAPFWAAAAEGEFEVQECRSCGLVFHYPRTLCPDCFSDNVAWLTAAGTGEVYSYTVTRQMAGWPEEALPLVLAYVELDEGPRVMTNIVDCDPHEVEVGTPVTVRFVETDHDDIAIPVFTPSEDETK